MFRRIARSLRSARRAQATQTLHAAAAPAVERLEARQLMAVSPVVAGSKVKGVNLSENNVSTNSTLVTVPFSGDINLVDATKLRMFGYATNPLSSTLGQVKKTINISNAQVLALDANGDGTIDHSLLQFTTDRLARKGATIIFNEGALTDKNGDTLATQQVKTVKGQNKERFTLACREFTITDHSRFTTGIYADASPTAASTEIPEATVTTNLTNFLQQKVTAGVISQAQANSALAIYNDAGAKLKVPAANLRAALVSLTGTFAAGAIDQFLSTKYTIVAFQDPQDPDAPVAKTSARSDGKLRTIVRPEFQGEPIQALSAQLAHEALHQDNSFGTQEEEFATIVEVLVTAQQAQHQILAGTKPVSTFLSAKTDLVNMANEKLAAMIQSGRTIFPYPGVFTAPHTINQSQGVFPGQKSVTGGNYLSFDDFIQRLYKARGSVSQNTTGNALLNQYYTAITTKTAAANMQFSTAVINDVDSFQSIMGTKLTLQLANALRMGLA